MEVRRAKGGQDGASGPGVVHIGVERAPPGPPVHRPARGPERIGGHRGSIVAMGITPSDLDVIGLVRAARRRADCSQRELAERAGVSASTIARIEAGTLAPSLSTLRAVLGAADVALVAVDREGRLLPPMEDDRDDLRDGAERRYPAHLDLVLDPLDGEWWGDRYGLSRPPETFHRDRRRRDAQRARSQWEVRVAQTRHLPPPVTAREWVRRYPDSS